MTAKTLSVNYPFSADVSAAMQIFSSLAALPHGQTRTEQAFVDRLMATALRHVAEGLRKFGVAMGVRQDEQGLRLCASSIAGLAGRTSAPIACEEAANVARTGRLTSAEYGIISAAAFALGGAV